jgi:hypothetical protein
MNSSSSALVQAFVISPFPPRGSFVARQTIGSSHTTSPPQNLRARPIEDSTAIEAEEQTLEGNGPAGRWPWHSRGVVLTPAPPPRGFVSATHRRTTTKKKTSALSAQKAAAMSKRGTRLQWPVGQQSVAARKPRKASSVRKASRVSNSAENSINESPEMD